MTIDDQVHLVVRGGTRKGTSTHIAEREADTTLCGLAVAGRGEQELRARGMTPIQARVAPSPPICRSTSASPARPWQRGSNENTNGLLRQYFPRGVDLSQHTPERLQAVADELNGRPRKVLDWESPAERITALLNNS